MYFRTLTDIYFMGWIDMISKFLERKISIFFT